MTISANATPATAMTTPVEVLAGAPLRSLIRCENQ